MNGLKSDPSLSPDGTRLAYTSQDASQTTPSIIRVSKLDGTHGYAIGSIDGGDLDGARWSPGGRLIAFNSVYNPVNNWNLWVVRADGSHPRKLLDTANTPGDPSGSTQQGSAWMWSPDGRSIAAQWPAGDPRGLITNVEVVNVVSGQARVLAQGSEPAWSPDGRRIAYASATGIDVIGIDGNGHRQLVRMPTSPGASLGVMPSWSPDGKTIAYWRTEKKLSGVLEPTLELIDAEGHAKPRRLLHLTDLGQRRPEWSRDSRTLLVSHDFSEIWLVPVRAGSSPRKLATGSEADWKG